LATQDFEAMVEKTHLALKEFFKGNPEPYSKLYSGEQDISLMGAQGGIAVGPKEVKESLTTRSSWFRVGENVRWERLVTVLVQDIGYVVELEQFDAKVGDVSEITHVALRVTTVFRRENGQWKLVHRQGDPLVVRIDPATYRSLAKHNLEGKAHA
jgi:ketosteroid isomerase-like protein